MDVLLITLAVLGVGAIIISAYVFMVAARTYVSDDAGPRAGSAALNRVARSASDRRRGASVSFPLMVNGILIEHDRRCSPDRRKAAAG